MTTTDFTTQVIFDRPAADVYNAINNVGGWWQGAIEGSAEKVGDEFDYRMKEFHFSRQRVVEQVPNERIVWLVTDSHLSFVTPADEWTGTTLRFGLSEAGGKTVLSFAHEGLSADCACFGACSNGWTKLLHESLASLVATGEGKIVF